MRSAARAARSRGGLVARSREGGLDDVDPATPRLRLRRRAPVVRRALLPNRFCCRSDPGGSRTRDLRIKSPLLYQLSYRVECLHLREVGACVRSACRGQRPQSKRFLMPLRDRPRLGRPSVLIARPAASITALAARLTMRPRDALAA